MRIYQTILLLIVSSTLHAQIFPVKYFEDAYFTNYNGQIIEGALQNDFSSPIQVLKHLLKAQSEEDFSKITKEDLSKFKQIDFFIDNKKNDLSAKIEFILEFNYNNSYMAIILIHHLIGGQAINSTKKPNGLLKLEKRNDQWCLFYEKHTSPLDPETDFSRIVKFFGNFKGAQLNYLITGTTDKIEENMKALLSIFICLFFIQSCATSKKAPPTPERIKFSFYIRDWDASQGALLGKDQINYGSKFRPAHYRLKAHLNYSQYEVPSKYFNNPKALLSTYLSVWNPILYNSLFLSEPKEKFDPLYLNSFRRQSPPTKKEDHQEQLKILMEYQFNWKGKDYFFSKNTFYKFTGEAIPKCFCLQKETDKWFFNDEPTEKVNSIFDLFCHMKLEVAKIFFHTRFYPGFDLEKPLPPSGNKYLDREIKRIHIATHTQLHFNAEKFLFLKKQWEKENKKGVLDYFFEK